jgi:hypothetical protein
MRCSQGLLASQPHHQAQAVEICPRYATVNLPRSGVFSEPLAKIESLKRTKPPKKNKTKKKGIIKCMGDRGGLERECCCPLFLPLSHLPSWGGFCNPSHLETLHFSFPLRIICPNHLYKGISTFSNCISLFAQTEMGQPSSDIKHVPYLEFHDALWYWMLLLAVALLMICALLAGLTLAVGGLNTTFLQLRCVTGTRKQR